MGEYENARGVYFADGGYLDNKPFSYATEALRRRRADVPVAGRLVSAEPEGRLPEPRGHAVAPALRADPAGHRDRGGAQRRGAAPAAPREGRRGGADE